MEMTLEQKRAIALASARLRLSQSPAVPEEAPITGAEKVAGNPLTRFALGAASPFLGAAQLGAEAFGSSAVTDHLKQLEEMKGRGMSSKSQLDQLKESRETLSRLPGYEAQIALIDRQIAALGQNPSSDPSTAGVDVAGISGAMASPVALKLMKIAPASGAGGRIAQNAGIGAAFGLTQPVTEGDFATEKAIQTGVGGALGAAVPPAIGATRYVYDKARNIVDPLLEGGVERSVGRTLLKAAGDKRVPVMEKLAEEKQFVPGSVPTAAEAAAPAGSAEFSGLQRLAEKRLPTEFSDIKKAQEAARKAAIQEFGKDSTALKVAEDARKAGADSDYAIAYAKSIKADPALVMLSQNPYFKKALPTALDLAKANNITPKENLTEFLHYVKLGLDDQLSGNAREAIGRSEQKAVGEVKKRLLAWMQKKNPSYEEARANFASASKPINQMQVGQELERALTSPMETVERPGVFAGAMRDIPKTIKKATGQSINQPIENVLAPQQLQGAQGVLDDLIRSAEHSKLARSGAQQAAALVGEAVPGLPATGPLHQKYMIFKTIFNRFGGRLGDKELEMLSKTLKTPKETLRLMKEAAEREKVGGVLSDDRVGRSAVFGGVLATE